ncbi:MAG TPA: GNAT family N-acetyltransferase [Gemmatimonadales bacterium]|nr:GNAT family N-acetyltransferase [Gemmatimonadales bacterium]
MPDRRVVWESSDPAAGWRDARDLLVSAHPAPPFADPALVDGLRTVFRPGESLRVATSSDESGTPRGQLALVLRRTLHGPILVRQLEGGPRNQASLSEFLGAADPAAAIDLLEQIRMQSDWDLLELRAVPAAGALARAAIAVGATVRPDVPAHAIELEPGTAILSPERRRRLGRLRRRMAEATAIQVERVVPDEPRWGATVTALTHWHVDRWDQSRSPSPFASAQVTTRFVQLLAAPPHGVHPVATVLRHPESGTISGVVLGFRSGEAIHAWRIAYDRSLSEYSPGIQMVTELANWGMETGIKVLEMGRGAEPYKQTWRCIVRDRVTVRWHRPTAATRALGLIARLTGRSGLAGWGG